MALNQGWRCLFLLLVGSVTYRGCPLKLWNDTGDAWKMSDLCGYVNPQAV